MALLVTEVCWEEVGRGGFAEEVGWTTGLSRLDEAFRRRTFCKPRDSFGTNAGGVAVAVAVALASACWLVFVLACIHNKGITSIYCTVLAHNQQPSQR